MVPTELAQLYCRRIFKIQALNNIGQGDTGDFLIQIKREFIKITATTTTWDLIRINNGSRRRRN